MIDIEKIKKLINNELFAKLVSDKTVHIIF